MGRWQMLDDLLPASSDESPPRESLSPFRQRDPDTESGAENFSDEEADYLQATSPSSESFSLDEYLPTFSKRQLTNRASASVSEEEKEEEEEEEEEEEDDDDDDDSSDDHDDIYDEVDEGSTPLGGMSSFEIAIERLKDTRLPAQLPCREEQVEELKLFLAEAIAGQSSHSRTLLVAGVPGTGKTSSVLTAIEHFAKQESGAFDYHVVNALKLSHPTKLYGSIWRQLSKVQPAGGRGGLGKLSVPNLRDRLSYPIQRKRFVLIVDELDELAKSHALLYNIFDWPCQPQSQLVVIGIANTIDLQRKLPPKVASRLGSCSLTFKPYRKADLEEIICSRLASTQIFAPDTLSVVAARVASLSGDARRGLDICRRAAELAFEEDSSCQSVGLHHVLQAGEGMFVSYELLTIERSSLFQQIVLLSLVVTIRSQNSPDGPASAELKSVYDRHLLLCLAIDRPHLTPERFRELVNLLDQTGLLEIVTDSQHHVFLKPPGGLDLQEIVASVATNPLLAEFCESHPFLNVSSAHD
ncbi:MAG: orc1/cdc6 family replication initiation protein [archaeon]|nr:orc1/cdc6 family replication initiation protein [archaeon]